MARLIRIIQQRRTVIILLPPATHILLKMFRERTCAFSHVGYPSSSN